ncbi:MAG: SLBB domain-containing protein [Eubacterium sp.]|nr:SLBB domain-containing protein [Eubacterium sp.]
MNKMILDQIKEAGIVGAGGAGFPTHAKLNCEPEYILANCAECEPLIKSDKHLMERHAAEIVAGMETVVSCTGAAHGVIALKSKNTEAVRALEAAAAGTRVQIHQLENYYPAGDEQQIIYEVTGRRVPVGDIPIKAGCVVMNGQTLFQVAQAVKGIPVTSRMVTVTGAVAEPFTTEVPIGTAVSYLLDLAGGPTIDDYVIVLGGPLMGRVVQSADGEFVTKTTNGVIVLPKDNVLIKLKTDDLEHQLKIARSACCQCNYCTMICPRNALGLHVQPHKIMQALTIGNGELLGDGSIALGCCNCGLCTYVGCNMGLTPSRFISEVRAKLLAQKVKNRLEMGKVDLFRDEIKVDSHRVIGRMNLTAYDVEVPFVENICRPRAVRILLKQHIGAPCEPAVSEGSFVTKGQVVGQVPEKALGAPVHASISGRVVSATKDHIDILEEQEVR